MMNKEIPYKIYLEEQEMPKQWYNVRADMKKKPAPILNPGTLQPVTADELSKIFCEELAKQELDDTTPYFAIPQEILDFYKMYRPSPLVRAYCLEKSWVLRHIFIINSREIIPPEAISLILRLPRLIMPRIRA